MANNAGWLDYFTPIDFQSSNDILISHRPSDDEFEEDELLTRAKWAWNIGQNEKEYKNEHGLTFEVSIPRLINRHFLVHESDQVRQSSSKVPLLIFFHGLNSSAWFMALIRTKWIEKANINNFLVVFGQSQGKQFRKGPKYNQHGILQFGDDLSWEIQEPNIDLIYFDSILEYMKEHYEEKLDLSRIYYVGYSNGGLFSSNVTIHYGGHVLSAICNHCGGYGGLGYRDEELLDPSTIKKPVPIYILTGTRDSYLRSCEKAKTLFENVGCPIKMEIMNNRGHRYYVDKEADIWHFLSSHQIKDEQ
jgi:predicted esterase